MCADKKKNEKSKKKHVRTESIFAEFFESNLATICLTIGLLDLAHALFFVVESMISLVTSVSTFNNSI